MILVTGAGGYIGRNLLPTLDFEEGEIRRLSIGESFMHRQNFATLPIKLITKEDTIFDAALENVSQIIFLASSGTGNPLINVLYPCLLAERALQITNITRFTFVSSCKVYGEYNIPGKPFTSESDTSPKTQYGRSKVSAELQLTNIFYGKNSELVILRLPNIVGSGSTGLFRFLVNCVKRKIPIPVSGTNSLKSFLGCDELCAIISSLTDQKAPYNSISNISCVNLKNDSQDIYYKRMIALIGDKVGKKPLLFPVTDLNVLPPIVSNSSFCQRFMGIYSNFEIKTGPLDEKFMNLTPHYRDFTEMINESI